MTTLLERDLPKRRHKQDAEGLKPREPALDKLARKVLKPYLADFGFKRASVQTETSSEGEALLVVTIQYDEAEKELDGETLLRAHAELQRKFWQEGEYRFPYLRHSSIIK